MSWILNIETFKYLNGLAIECSRLIQSFSEKVKGSAVRGMQFKVAPKKRDEFQEYIRSLVPEEYRQK